MECFTFIKLIFCGNKKYKLVTIYHIKNQQSRLTIHLGLYAHAALLRLNTAQNRNFGIFSGILPYQFSTQYDERKIPVMI